MIGTTVAHYKIVKRLGAGGMGEVYLALDTELGRQVALKFLPAALSHDPDVRARFKREAQSLAALNHPHIVTVHGVTEHQGQPFIIMEHVSGKSIRTLCSEGDVPLAQAVEWAIQMAEGLAVAHKAEIVHRDIKSDNILISSDQRVKILDFGLATRQGLVRLTREGSTIGTMAYMSPEQAHGQEVDLRSDLFSLGVVLYELTTRQLPFKGEHEAAIAYAVMHEDPQPMARYSANVPEEWQRIVAKCLSKKVDERYQSASDLAADLKAFQRRLGGAAMDRPAVDKKPSIAVLPFVNLSADPENEYFSDGLTEELLNVLARNSELKVTGRTSSFAFKGKQQDLREIGQKLGVDTLLEGSVRKSGNRVRITAQIVNTSDGFHLWSSTFDRVIEDVFAVQDEIAGAVGRALNVTLLGKSRPRVIKNSEAYTLILQGTHLSYQNSTESLKEAERSLKRALDLEPTNAEAWAALSNVYIVQGGYGHDDHVQMFEQAKVAAQRAIEHDDQNPQGHLHLGWIYLSYKREWARCRQEMDRAAELAPGDTRLLFPQAALEACWDSPAKAQPILQKAVELDPLNATLYFHSGRFHWWSGRFPEAALDLKKALALSPDFASAHACLAMVHLASGDALAALQEALLEAENGYRFWAFAIVSHALGKKADSDEALAGLESKGRSWACQLAGAEACRGQNDSAFRWLEVALEHGDPGTCWTKAHPHLAHLYSDPRWPGYLKKLGLPQ